jgi:hypothetical protein
MAALWYSISYIPFARKMIGAYFRRQAACGPFFIVYDAIQEQLKKIFPQPTTAERVMGVATGKGAATSKTSGSSSTATAPSKKGFTWLQDEDEL